MSDITTRSGKGSPLTHDEVDANFNNLNNDKYQSGDDATLGSITVTGTSTLGTTSVSGFTSTGIDDNATSTQLTIGIDDAQFFNPALPLSVGLTVGANTSIRGNLDCDGFTSTGIDDNATSTKLTITDSGIAATLTTAAQPNITSVGTLTGFTSTGIDDNATETALTIDANEHVQLTKQYAHLEWLGEGTRLNRLGSTAGPTGGAFIQNYTDGSGAHFFNSGAVSIHSGNEDKVTAELQIDTSGIVQVGQFSGTDFRVDVDTLAVDASEDRVGINTLTPSTELHVKGVSAGDLATLTIESTATNLVKGTSRIKLLSQASDYSDQEFEIAAVPGGATSGGKFTSYTSGGSTSGVGSFVFVSRANGGTGSETTLASITPDGIEAPAFKASQAATTTALSITDSGQVTTGENLIVTGDETVGGDLTISGNLTVQGTTTTINTANLNVEDKNITLNYSSGDSSVSADGAGITIQDAVNSTTDATILWDATDDKFNFSHAINVSGNLTSTGIDDNATSTAITIDSSQEVGIGVTAPQAPFHARKSTAVAAELEVGRFETFLTGPTNAQQILKILEDNRSGGGLTPYSRFESVFISSDGSTLDAGFQFGGNSAGSYLTIDSSGNTAISGDLTVDTSTLYVDSTNNRVGINDSTPSEELDITGDGSDARIRMYDGAGASVARFEHSGANLDISNTATATATMSFTTGSGSGTPKMTINASGNVGIGTTNFSNTLTVSKNVTGDDLVYFNNENAVASDVLRLNTLGAGSGTKVLDCQVAGVSKFVVNGLGNVGISETNPTSKLVVRNDGVTTSQLELGGATGFRYELGRQSVGGLFRFYGQQSGYSGYIFDSVDGERMRIDSSGNVGIGVTSPTSGKLCVDGTINITDTAGTYAAGALGYTDANWGFLHRPPRAGATGAHAFQSFAGSTLMTVTDGGNVGIGVTPSVKLDIATASGSTYVAIRRNSQSAGEVGLSLYGGTSGINWSLYQPTSSNDIRFYGNGADRLTLTSNGDLLVGKTASGDLSVDGFEIKQDGQMFVSLTGTATNTFHYYNSTASQYRFYVKSNGGIANFSANNSNLSDRRTKKDIVDSGDYLAKLCQIPVRNFRYNHEEDGGKHHLGVISQEVEAVAPELVQKDAYSLDDETTRDAVYTTDLNFAMLKAIQEQQAMIEALQAEVAALKGA